MRLRGWEQDAELTHLPNTDDHAHFCSREHTCLLPLQWPDCPGTLNPLLWPQKGKWGYDEGKRKAGNCHCCWGSCYSHVFLIPPGLSSHLGFPPSPPQKSLPVERTREPLSHSADSEVGGEAPRAGTTVLGFFLPTQFGIHKSFSCILGNKSYKLQFISTIRTFHCKLVCLRLEAHCHLWHFEMGEQMLWIPNSFLINSHLKDRDRKYLIKSHGVSVSWLQSQQGNWKEGNSLVDKATCGSPQCGL